MKTLSTVADINNADDTAQCDAAIVEYLVQPMHLAGAHGIALAPVARQQVQFAQELFTDI